jgi:hypothetical protein
MAGLAFLEQYFADNTIAGGGTLYKTKDNAEFSLGRYRDLGISACYPAAGNPFRMGLQNP